MSEKKDFEREVDNFGILRKEFERVEQEYKEKPVSEFIESFQEFKEESRETDSKLRSSNLEIYSSSIDYYHPNTKSQL